MEFTFKRDEEGKERIYCKGIKVGEVVQRVQTSLEVPGVTVDHIDAAIDLAWAMNFWPNFMTHRRQAMSGVKIEERVDEVTVDVPIAETTVLSVTLDGDES
jgi:hypothetical protein